MFIVIVNSYSGQHKSNYILKQMKQHFSTRFVSYFTHQYQGDEMWQIIHDKINETGNALKGVIVVGGDGTLHQTIQHLHDIDVPFGLIPSGSGNDFGRSLKISNNTKKAIKRIIHNQPKTYDLLRVQDKRVLSIVGIGVDAVTASLCQHSKLKKWLNRAFLGKLTYLLFFFKAIKQYEPVQATITDENGKQTFDRVWLIAGGNTNYYGGGIPICPQSDPHDGKADLVIVHGLSLIKLVVILPSVFFRRHLSLPYVHSMSGTTFQIESSHQTPVQGDGEKLCQTPITVTVEQDAVRFF
ncbi:YegS/Rv2252/BmrU family lipid kinase [Bacillus shivajii]|uniref:diacylglycerol/lipid kinase family protein n=1 Tax=Bacillus shivajii TaxID=1983719 RepID=UPI001CFA6A07|nr:YegS/Rv2252/BmrU family lipid kinase [Bacillus shivajii]UCZ54853.1 YegS/Rv2252/BmrU family lipid kinase [Bacillus shivajii]